MPEETLGDRIRWSRETAGLSQGQAAKLLDLPKETLGAMEGDNLLPAHCVMNDFSRHYDVDLHWLQTGQEREVSLPPMKNVTEADRESLRRLQARRRQDS